MTKRQTDEEIINKLERLYELERDCSTGRRGTPEEQRQKIDAMLARARARKQQEQTDGKPPHIPIKPQLENSDSY